MEEIKRFNRVIEIRENVVLFEKPKQISPPSSPDIKFLQKQESFSNKSSSQTVSVRLNALKDRLHDFSAKLNIESINQSTSNGNSYQKNQSPLVQAIRSRDYSIEINSPQSSKKAIQLCKKVSFKYKNKIA